MTRTQTIDLASAAGQQWQFRPADGAWAAIQVPAGGWKTQGHSCICGVYRTRIAIPADAGGQAIRLAFAAVNFGARVFFGVDEANLQLIAEHIGGWMPFQVDLSDLVEPGKSYLLHVDVRGKEAFKRNGKYIVAEAGPWQPLMADGIIRGITLEILPAIYIDDLWVRTSVDDDTIQPEIALVNTTKQTVSVTLRSKLAAAGTSTFAYPEIADVPVSIAPNERIAVDLGRTLWGLGPDSYWWPNVPYRERYRSELHRLDVTLAGEDGTMHESQVRFGFRQFQAKGNAYFLNGVHCNLRGDNQQEANFGTDAYGIFPGFGPPTDENYGWPGAVDNLLRANHNVLRIHQVPGTSYMLDVADELGLMIVDETPVRGSEVIEDFVAGRQNMIRAASELALRDRSHPSIVLWSAANEIWGQRGLALALQAAMLAVDDTRPIIIDGVEDLGPEIINMEHYCGGLGILPEKGGTPRTDRPYGETESVWPADNSLRGFAWMSTATRIRRLKGNADIRNYVLNNAWCNYVPGQSDAIQYLEKKIKDIRWEGVIEKGFEIMPPIEEPWNNRLIRLMQQSFDPYATYDIEFDEANKNSDADGSWPSVAPTLKPGAASKRRIAVFNDTFTDATLTVHWELRRDDDLGALLDAGSFTLAVPSGEHRIRPIHVRTPASDGQVALILRTEQNGATVFGETAMRFVVG